MSAEAETERKPGGIVPVVIVVVLAIALGGGVGAFAVGPMLVGGGEASASAEGEHGGEAAAESGGHGKKGGHGSGTGSELYTIENLVVNPAGTQGTRFLIVTLALAPDNSATHGKLVASDAAIRDTLLQVLAAKTIQELSDPAQREQVREEMRIAAESVIRPGRIAKLFLPQFVLQ